jgi:Protein of unknown function (DUF3237)
MRLEHLCDFELAYRSEVTLVRPYGSEAGSGYGEIEGTLTGEKLRGTFRGVNHPRRRGDGAMLPDAHGLIQTEDGCRVLFSLEGRTVWVDTPDGRAGRQLLLALFEAEAEAYRWLNDTVCILEGKISAQTGRMQARVYTCISELV